MEQGEWVVQGEEEKQGTSSEAPTIVQSKKVDWVGVSGDIKRWGQSLGIPKQQNG